jgi:outer membrane protein TolC
VLDAARQKYELEELYAVARLAVVVAYIALYKALGGGWELYQEIPPIATPLPAVVAAFHVRH